MKNIITIIIFVIFHPITIAQNIHIPDINFKTALVSNSSINTNGDNEISEAEAEAFTGFVSVPNSNITDLTGISYFTNITGLDCSFNEILTIDLHYNTSLLILFCNENPLDGGLYISTNTLLQNVSCSLCNLTSLDISNNTALTELYCDGNFISNLDVSSNTSLSKLNCSNNQLTSIYISATNQLEYLDCSGNMLILSELYSIKSKYPELSYTSTQQVLESKSYELGSEVDLSSEAHFNGHDTKFIWYLIDNSVADNSHVEVLGGGKFRFLNNGTYYCRMTNGAFPQTEIITKEITIFTPEPVVTITDKIFLDALISNESINTNGDGQISLAEAEAYTGNINVGRSGISDLTGIECFKNITALFCDYNNLLSLDISANTKLTRLVCNDNQLSSIDISANTLLTSLNCQNNQLLELNVSSNDQLWDLTCYGNQISSLDVSNNRLLRTLNVNNNLIIGLDLRNNILLTSLFCKSNLLTSLQVNQNPSLQTLYCSNNQITSIDLSSNLNLESFTCNKNQVTMLDLSNNTKLKSLDCSYNNISSLNLSNLQLLISLGCAYNNITKLDVSNNLSLASLSFSGNPISTIDLTNNEQLQTLYCHNCLLSTLDLTHNQSIKWLHCYNNVLTSINLNAECQFNSFSCADNKMLFSDLYDIRDYYTVNYSSDKPLFDEQTQVVGYELNWSSEASFDGNNTNFKWYRSSDNVEVNSSIVESIGMGIFKFHEAGSYYCKMTNASFPFVELVTNCVNISLATNIEDVSGVEIFPNPFVHSLTVTNNNARYSSGKIYDTSGNMVKSITLNNGTVRVNVSELLTGVYLLQLVGDDCSKIHKLIKQ